MMRCNTQIDHRACFWITSILMIRNALLITVLFIGSVPAADQDGYVDLRNEMIREINVDVSITRFSTGKEAFDSRVMAAMRKVPRHEFVPRRVRGEAYENRPLAIGYGQTISQPYIVALMTDLLGVDDNDVVLEVGTGSGYQAAVLAELVKQVYSIEIIAPLGKQSAERLERLGYRNVSTRVGDGYYGWKAHAPFDGIIVTAAANHIPPPLIQQLKPGGRMIIPIGSWFFTQQLMQVDRTLDGHIKTRQILTVRFVPLTGDH